VTGKNNNGGGDKMADIVVVQFFVMDEAEARKRYGNDPCFTVASEGVPVDKLGVLEGYVMHLSKTAMILQKTSTGVEKVGITDEEYTLKLAGEWLNKHSEVLDDVAEGTWLAICSEGIIGRGEYDEAERQAKQDGRQFVMYQEL